MRRKMDKGALTPTERRRFQAAPAADPATKPTHGGVRPNSGTKALFRGKNPMPKSILLTDAAISILDGAVARTETSRNDVVEALLRRHGEELTREQLRRTASAAA